MVSVAVGVIMMTCSVRGALDALVMVVVFDVVVAVVVVLVVVRCCFQFFLLTIVCLGLCMRTLLIVYLSLMLVLWLILVCLYLFKI